MKNFIKLITLLTVLIYSFIPGLTFADAVRDEDQNIQIIFPPGLMEEMLSQTTPELMSNLKFSNASDKSKMQGQVDQFHQEFLQNFNSLVTDSLKQNFTPEEIAQWAQFETTPLGKKTMYWLKTKYPAILNKAMDQPMQDLYKSMAQ